MALFSEFTDSNGNPHSEDEPVHDSVIREFTMAGSVKLVWRSWTHRNTLTLSDCERGTFPGNYSFINSLPFIDDGIVASSRGCAQAIRIERSGSSVLSKTTWKLGGSDPRADPDSDSDAEISWGVRDGSQVAANETIAVSEIELDPDAGTARALLHLHMSQDGKPASTYRVHRSPEVDFPLNLS